MKSMHLLFTALLLFLLACASDPVYDLKSDRVENWDHRARTTLEGTVEDHRSRTSERTSSEKDEEKADVDLKEDGVRVSHLVNRALKQNKAVRSAREQWKAAVYKARATSGLPDPKLMSMVAVEPIQTRDGPIDWQATLSQRFPWFGTLDAKEKKQLANAGRTYAHYRRKRNEVVEKVKTNFAEYRYLTHAIDIVGNMANYLDRMEDGVREAYESGDVPVHDLLRVRNEKEQVRTRGTDLDDRRRAVRAKLNQLLDRRTNSPFGAPANSSFAIPDLDQERLREVLVKHRPGLDDATFREHAARQELRSARLSYYPDFQAGIMYSGVGDSNLGGTVDAGSDAYGVQFTIDLPLWQGQRQARVRSARAEKRSARRQFEEEKNQGFAQLSGILAELREQERRVRLYRDTIIPNAERSLSSAREEYESGDMDIVSFLDFQNRVLMARLELRRARSDRRKTAAELEKIIGTSLDRVSKEQ